MNFAAINYYLSSVSDLFNQRSTLEFPDPKEKNWLSGDEIYGCLAKLFGETADIISPNISSTGNIFSESWLQGTIQIMQNLSQLLLDQVSLFSYFSSLIQKKRGTSKNLLS